MDQTFFSRIANISALRSVGRAVTNRRGVTALEYGLVAALAAVAIIAAMGSLNDGLTSVFGSIKTELTNAGNSISGSGGSN